MPTKVYWVKAMVLLVMDRCESWTIQKTEHRRTGASELWCWRRLLGAPWTARSSNQSILKEISTEYSLEGLMLKLQLQYFGHLMQRVDSLERPWCWEGLRAGGEGDDRGWDGWMASPSWWPWVWVNSGSWWWTGRPGGLRFMGSQRVGHDWATELNWPCFGFVQTTGSYEFTIFIKFGKFWAITSPNTFGSILWECQIHCWAYLVSHRPMSYWLFSALFLWYILRLMYFAVSSSLLVSSALSNLLLNLLTFYLR